MKQPWRGFTRSFEKTNQIDDYGFETGTSTKDSSDKISILQPFNNFGRVLYLTVTSI